MHIYAIAYICKIGKINMKYQTETKLCQNCEKDFIIELEDFSFYEKMKVSAPTFCPECRLIRRLIWRNERSLYKRECDLCKKKVISIYDREVPFSVFCKECWKSYAWDAMSYGLSYNPNKTFFSQWFELFNKVPRVSIVQYGDCVNSEYANSIKDVKNVYLAYSIVYDSENVFYSKNVERSKNIIDCLNITDSEYQYGCINGDHNYQCQYVFYSASCIDSYFLLDCSNCSNCFGCVNLRNKSYCIWNEQYDRESYFKILKEIKVDSYKFVSENDKKFWDFSLKFPRKYSRILNCINSSGDDLRNCKNVSNAFYIYDSEDTKYAHRCLKLKDCMDVTYNANTTMSYEHAAGGSDQSSVIKFVIYGAPALNEVEYIDNCSSSSHIFGCIGIKNKKYCILNKQYEKDEYEKLVEKIKSDMNQNPYIDKNDRVYKYGEFFPFEFSPFGYNETVINEIFPLSKEEAIQMGYSWKDKEDNKYDITLKAKDLSDNIKDVKDSILNETIECGKSGKPFRITQYELEFYRKMNIPLPRLHQDERYKNRMQIKGPIYKIWHRSCVCHEITHGHNEKCQNQFETTYAPERPEKVYCEDCYKKEIY